MLLITLLASLVSHHLPSTSKLGNLDLLSLRAKFVFIRVLDFFSYNQSVMHSSRYLVTTGYLPLYQENTLSILVSPSSPLQKVMFRLVSLVLMVLMQVLVSVSIQHKSYKYTNIKI